MRLLAWFTSGILPLSRAPALRALARRCWPKEPHATRGAADAQLRSILKRGLAKDEERIHVYRCPFCRRWHVGHDHADAVAPAPEGGV